MEQETVKLSALKNFSHVCKGKKGKKAQNAQGREKRKTMVLPSVSQRSPEGLSRAARKIGKNWKKSKKLWRYRRELIILSRF